jgi:hypothetical protein
MQYVYDVKSLSIQEFERMRKFVEQAYLLSLRSPKGISPMNLHLVTENLGRTMFTGKPGVAEAKYFGFAWPEFGHIWLRPGREERDVARTAIHELSHLRVTGQSHGSKWRRVFGVALAMYRNDCGDYWSEISLEIYRYVMPYRKYRRFTPQGEYVSPVDHSRKVQAERDEIYRAAMAACGEML